VAHVRDDVADALRRTLREAHPPRLGRAGGDAEGQEVQAPEDGREVSYGGRGYEIIVFRDAGERLACEAAQEESAALRSVTELANAAAHEINNPLAAVFGSLDLLALRVAAGSTEAGWVGLAQRAAERIRDIVAHMRHITRLERAEPVAGITMLDLRKSGEPGPREPVKPDDPPGA